MPSAQLREKPQKYCSKLCLQKEINVPHTFVTTLVTIKTKVNFHFEISLKNTCYLNNSVYETHGRGKEVFQFSND